MFSSGVSGADVVDGGTAGPENNRYSYESSIFWGYNKNKSTISELMKN